MKLRKRWYNNTQKMLLKIKFETMLIMGLWGMYDLSLEGLGMLKANKPIILSCSWPSES